ncbi:unnamed protein product [Cylicocyclus nassatus]|uniref:CHK kinase-like domain-containing protein n=1 Tax=Cylicocyclus nassatus TaxID=53992 RepID=A0AA36HH72_CYLNA|nr:unnamed protein product [Cylicocyclus nassatus]
MDTTTDQDATIPPPASSPTAELLATPPATAHEPLQPLDLSEEALLASDPESRQSRAPSPKSMECSSPSRHQSPDIRVSTPDSSSSTSLDYSPPHAPAGFSTADVKEGDMAAAPFPKRHCDPIPVGQPRPGPSRGRSKSLGAGRFPRKQSQQRQTSSRGRPAARSRTQSLRARRASRSASRATRPAELPQRTPENYSHYLTGLHPWANLIAPRPIRVLRDQDLQAGIVLDNDVYRQLPASGYLSHRVDHFAFVTPRQRDDKIFGIVLSTLVRRDRIQSFQAAFEDAPDPVVVPPSVCAFDIATVQQDEMLLAESRYNVSTAIRFSEPPVSVQAQNQLCEAIRHTLPMHPSEGLLPLKVFRLDPQEYAWLDDRLGKFDSFHEDPQTAKRKMSKLFNVACSALAALDSLVDDKVSHWVTATIPNLTAYPIRLDFRLENMASEAGWMSNRSISLWVVGASSISRAQIRSVETRAHEKLLIITAQAFPWSHEPIARSITTYGRHFEERTFVDICVRLGKQQLTTSSPYYEIISRMNLVNALVPSSIGDAVIDTTYGRASITCANVNDPVLFSPQDGEVQCLLNGREVTLTPDQRAAVALGLSRYPIVAIQAAFGTGKTVVGALIAALLTRASCPVIVTATTNAAVAQFAETLLALNNPELVPVRYLSDSAASDNTNPTPVDLNTLLANLEAEHGGQMTEEEITLCRDYRDGRRVIERYLQDPDQVLQMTEEDKEEYLLSERFVSRNLQKMVNLLFRLRSPNILLATTASLLNTTSPGGIFTRHIHPFKVLIGDEASQIPEPVLVALAIRLPSVRHIYIGDVYQLEPHAKCSRTANPAIYGARSIMDVLNKARAVPVAPLHTTFRVHPDLIQLSNRVAYEGRLISGIRRQDRQMLLSVMHFPHPQIPFLFLDLPSSSIRAPSKSLYNETEARMCWEMIDRLRGRGIDASSICVITFYREQYRRLRDTAEELVAIIDYQLLHTGNFAEDIARTLMLTMSRQQRWNHTNALLKRYHDTLTSLSNGNPPYPISKVKKHYVALCGYVKVNVLRVYEAYERIFPYSMNFGLFAMATYFDMYNRLEQDEVKRREIQNEITDRPYGAITDAERYIRLRQNSRSPRRV